MTGESAQNSATRTIDLDVPENEVLYSIKDRVATVMLNRPERMNATNLTLPYSVSKAMLMAANVNAAQRDTNISSASVCLPLRTTVA